MMAPANYALRDAFGSVLGCLLFIPLLLSPGYVVAWFFGILDFRGITAPWRVLVSLPLSVALCPILTYWFGPGGPLPGASAGWITVFSLYGLCFLIWLLLLAGLWGHEKFPEWLRGFGPVPRAGWIIAGTWFLLTIVFLVDLQFHNRLYLSFTNYDHLTRAAITDAISRGGVRPVNPFYSLGSPAPLRYHYFWFLLCSIDTKLGGPLVSAPVAIIASIVWCGWSLIALVPLYLRFFDGRTGAALRRYSLVAIGLFAVTGLDIIPTAIHAAMGRVYPEMEWWNEQVTSWFGAVLWVPHHVAGLIACLIGFLLIWNAGSEASLRRRITSGVLAGAAFASATGTSIYVTLVFCIFLVVWAVVMLIRGGLKSVAVMVTAGVAAALLVVPYLLSLMGPGAGGAFVKFTVRQFNPLILILEDPNPSPALRLLVLPLNYFLELGFFGVAAIVFLLGVRRQRELRLNVLAAITMLAVSVGVCTFMRSGVIGANDLGWRGFLPAQFIMLLWGAHVLVEQGERAEVGEKGIRSWWLRSPVWAPLLILGVAATCYELVLSRTYFLLNDAGLTAHSIFAPDRQFGERALELRRTYETLNRILPVTAKLQANPEGWYFDFYNGLYSNRQTVVLNPTCGAEFGGDTAPCAATFANLRAVFDGAPSATWPRVEAYCRTLSIDALIVTDFDRAWQSDRTWGGQARPAIDGKHVRVYLIGDPRQSPGTS
jgi:hypothetical protein